MVHDEKEMVSGHNRAVELQDPEMVMSQKKLCLDARGQCTYRLTRVVIAFTRSVQAQVRQNPSKKRDHEH